MTMKKTVREPVAAADGVPILVSSEHLDITRELPACEAAANAANAMDEASPRAILDDDVTVPVQSSIESTLTFELLRRQSTQSDEEGAVDGALDKDEVAGDKKTNA
jgi:hypothetical protein